MATGRTVHIEAVDGVELVGDLAVPAQAVGLVLFAHGSGSSWHSRRNQAVAATFRDRGLATLLLDLLTAGEEAVDALSGQLRFDIAQEWLVTIAPTVRPSTLDKYQRDLRAHGFLCTDVGSLDRSACRASVTERFSVQRFIDGHLALYRRVLRHQADLVA